MKTVTTILMLMFLLGCKTGDKLKFSQSCPQGTHTSADGNSCIKD